MSLMLADMILDLPKSFALDALVPLITLAGLMVLALVTELSDERQQGGAAMAGVGVAALSALVGWLVFQPLLRAPVLNFSGMLIDDRLSRATVVVVAIALILALLAGPAELEKYQAAFRGEFFVLLFAAALGMVLMASAGNLIVMFLGLELFSLALYLLCIYLPRRLECQESGLKYFILSSAASAIMLYGMALLYGATGTTWLVEMTNANPGLLMTAGAVLVLCGLAFKVSAVPLHVWTPDVYEGAPTSVTAFMSVATKAAALTAMLRLFFDALPQLQMTVTMLAFALSLMSMLLGNMMALAQTRVKRLLAYSGIAHAGYLLMAFTVGDSTTPALYFYMMAYAFANAGAFLAVLALELRQSGPVTIKDLAGTSARSPMVAWMFAICLVSLTGLPPTAGFLGKYYLFGSTLRMGQYLLPVLGVVGSFIGASYYLPLVLRLFSEVKEEQAGVEEDAPVPTWLALGLLVAGGGTLLFGFFPNFILFWLGR